MKYSLKQAQEWLGDEIYLVADSEVKRHLSFWAGSMVYISTGDYRGDIEVLQILDGRHPGVYFHHMIT